MAEFTLTVEANDEIMLQAIRKTMAQAIGDMPISEMTPGSVADRSDDYKAGFAYGVEFFRETLKQVLVELHKL